MADGDEDGSGRGRQLIAATLVIVVLVLAGLWLSGALRSTGQLQDCVASGRSNCAPVGG